MSSQQQKAIVAVRVRGLGGRCSGCRTWWAWLTSYPCWQVEWATGRRTLTSTATSGGCAVTVHGPVMPIRSCGGCGLPWPCTTRKRELRAEYADAPVSLALYLGSYLVQATEDMRWTPAGVLHRRFLGWTRDAELPDAAAPQACQSDRARQ